MIETSKIMPVLRMVKIYNLTLTRQYLAIRYKVFINELARKIFGEFTAADITAKHYILLINKHPTGVVRVLYKDHIAEIGRVAILARYRNKGYGAILINQIINEIKISRKEYLISLFTETNNIEFYHKCGFMKSGEVIFDNVLLIGMKMTINR